jgi:hypothetical protein
MKKHYLFILAFVAINVCMLSGCDTTIPETDTTAPKVTFKLTGAGTTKLFESGVDYTGIQYNIRTGVEYTFYATVSDQGGCQTLELSVPNGVFNFGQINDTSGVVTPVTTGSSTYYRSQGDRSRPLTGLLLSGKFTPATDGEVFTISVLGRDFGGRAGTTPNVSRINVNTLQSSTDPLGEIEL